MSQVFYLRGNVYEFFCHNNAKRFHLLCKLNQHHPVVHRKCLHFFPGARHIRTCNIQDKFCKFARLKIV